jgi:hypothetical protein
MTKKKELEKVCKRALKNKPNDLVLMAYLNNIVQARPSITKNCKRRLIISDNQIEQFIEDVNINYLNK